MNDAIKWEILEDGTVSVTTDQISGQNHLSADELLENLASMLGGPTKIEQKKGHGHKHKVQSLPHVHRH